MTPQRLGRRWQAMGTPFDAKLKAIYGSDIGRWYVPDMCECVAEACELVADGILDRDQLREFLFTNAVEFWTANNRDFFAEGSWRMPCGVS